MGNGASVGHYVYVISLVAKPGTIDRMLAALHAHHTPAVQQQPGFVAKVVMQSEAEPDRLMMLLEWATFDYHLAWSQHPEHETVLGHLREFMVRSDAANTTPRGVYRIVATADSVRAP